MERNFVCGGRRIKKNSSFFDWLPPTRSFDAIRELLLPPFQNVFKKALPCVTSNGYKKTRLNFGSQIHTFLSIILHLFYKRPSQFENASQEMCSITNTTVTSSIMNNNTIESPSTPTCQVTHYSFCPGCGVDVSQFSHDGSCPYLRR